MRPRMPRCRTSTSATRRNRALGFGTGSLELARLGTPSGVALVAAQIGLGAPALAAEPVAGVAYLPAVLHADAPAIEPLPQQF